MKKQKHIEESKQQEGNAQVTNVEIQAVLVTDKGQLPPVSNQSWYSSIITALPPDVGPRATVPIATVPIATVPM